MNKRPVIFVSLAALALAGASCGRVTTTTNTAIVTNAPPTNSRTTGSFTTNPPAAPAAVVTITSSGLDRPTVTITVGQRVEFRNGDTAAHWIASTPHPTHTDLPGFEKNIVGGGTYSYTFTRAGTFTYYDNAAPNDTRFNGRVIVQ